MLTGKRFFLLLVCIIILANLSNSSYAAKSVYVISDTWPSNLQAYKIEGTTLVYQTDYTCLSDPEGLIGAIGIAIDESRYGQFLFITFEESEVIEIVNARTMQYVDFVIAKGSENLAGIVIDKGKRKVYIIDRYFYGRLFVYSWDWSDPRKLYHCELEGIR